jgi:hypothetical protein
MQRNLPATTSMSLEVTPIPPAHIHSFCIVSAVSVNASAGFLGFGGESWQEEVLLHDGQKLIVERAQTRGGNHEIGQTTRKGVAQTINIGEKK